MIISHQMKDAVCEQINKLPCDTCTEFLSLTQDFVIAYYNITDEHLCTIEKYQLLTGLLDSNGIVDEGVLDKLKLTVRSLIASQSDCKDLLDLCVDVIFHDNMKALGLSALIELYHDWTAEDELETEEL